MSKRVLVHCTGCGETWEAAAGLIGALCGSGQVRHASQSEMAKHYDWADLDVEGEPYEDSYFPGIADYDRFGRPSWET